VLTETTVATGVKALVLMNMVHDPASYPYTTNWLKFSPANYKPLALKPVDANKTIIFIQNEVTRHAELLIVNWSQNSMTITSFNYGLASSFVITNALLFYQSNGGTDVYFTGFTSSLWGAEQCENPVSWY